MKKLLFRKTCLQHAIPDREVPCGWQKRWVFGNCGVVKKWRKDIKQEENSINFTKKTLDAISLPTAGKRFYFYDTKVRGLELMVTEHGSKSFKVYRKCNGKPVRVTLGKYPELTIENARVEAQRVIAKILGGENPNKEKKKLRAETTLGDMFSLYMERHSKSKKKTWRSDERDLPRFVGHWFQRPLSTITKQEVQILHEKAGRENGLYQANRFLSAVQGLYNRAIEWGWEGTNPAQGIKKFKEKSRKRFLHSDELSRFFKSLDQEQNDTIRDYVYVSLFTGVRRSNILAMQWKDVYFERQEWLVPTTKNGEPLRVHLVESVIALLKNRLEKYGKREWVFAGTGKTGHLVEPKAGWKRILKRMGVEDVRLHDLRRTLGSWQAATGANQYMIGESLGHKSPQSTAVYARLNIDPVRDAVEKATQAMLQYAKS